MVDLQLKDVHAGTRAGVYVRFSSRSREEKHLHSERNEDNRNNSDSVMCAHEGLHCSGLRRLDRARGKEFCRFALGVRSGLVNPQKLGPHEFAEVGQSGARVIPVEQ